MGDTDVPKTEILAESPECNAAKPSIDILKEVKPSENIAIEPSSEQIPKEKPVEDKSATEDTKIKKAKQELREKARNRSDIFSLNGNENLTSTIFSVGGAPSKTIHNTTSNVSDKSSASNDTVGTQNSNSSRQYRNPLTGIGVSSNDEFKNKPSKRRDGNPLLGLGYKDENPTHPSGQRIPPGGYSKGLW